MIWVQHAFGDFIGYVNAQTNLLAWLISQSLFLKLFITYLSQKVHFDTWAANLANFLFVWLIVNLNLIGMFLFSIIMINHHIYKSLALFFDLTLY